MKQKEIESQIKTLVKKFYRRQKEQERFVPGKSFIGVSAPSYDDREANHLISTLLANRLSMGAKTREFEGLFAKYIGTKHAVALNSGTSANTVALNVLMETGELKKGDEVLLPAATFSSVASPVIQLGLIPVYVDVDEKSYNIHPEEIKKAISRRTKAVIVVHSLGQPADLRTILSIAKKHKLKIIEDCCEAHGALYHGEKVGSFGDMATFSFFVAHNITTGEGGMIVTNRNKYESIARSLREFGRISGFKKKDRFSFYSKNLKHYDKKYIFERIGYNFRMTDLAASLGIEQLKKLERLNTIRRKIVAFYKKMLQAHEYYVGLPEEFNGLTHSWYGFPLVVAKHAPFSRLTLVEHLERHNIETRPFFAGCLPDQPGFSKAPRRLVGGLPVARYLRDRAVFIGCHPGISAEQAEYVCRVLENFLCMQ